MRLGQSVSGKGRRKDKLGKKKHKRLDAICEKAYSKCHSGMGSTVPSALNVGGDETEVRRSGRVRRPPVLLDTSPPPAKKRRKIEKRNGVSSVGSVKREAGIKRELVHKVSRDFAEGSSAWQSRLRTRGKSVGFKVKGKKASSPKGKRKLFDELEGGNEESISEAREFDEIKDEIIIEKSTVVKSQRPGRVKASNVTQNEHEVELVCSLEDDKESSEREVLELRDGGAKLLSSDETEDTDNSKANEDNVLPQFVDIEKSEIESDKQLEECQGEKLEIIEQEMEPEKQACSVGVNQANLMEVDDSAVDVDKGGQHPYKPLENETFEKLRKKDYTSDGPFGKLRIKEGRHCGLCGTGNDGKPPKKMKQDGAGSDSEAYSGSSASEDPTYDVWDGFDDEPGWLGRLLGPINDRFGIAGIWVHQHCAVWSPEVYFAGLGCLKNVRAALCRGRVLKCSRCGRPGATIGCRVDRCPKTYHLPCARANGCIFDHRKFLIACTDHKHLFQPHGTQYFDRLKKLKAKKMKLEIRKMSNDAGRKDVEAEEKWLENCGEDEEFLKRESKRLHRDLLRIAPTYIGGSSGNQKMQFEGWESVAGLQNVIQCMKEVVILPLLYPELFSNLGLTPPRGVLLHGYPGTGKTLVVRALIGSCARGDKRIAYFARKGADCLGKYVGDAERQLRLLFQVAEKSQPSIIFFDEIDGLAPCRSRRQDQTHSSVVSTLLALMDGLKSRGSVVVIGATNRPDAVDPALRRPGRFDREIYFPLPSVRDREAILSLHTQKWPKPITGSLLKCIASKTVGYAGADLQALCTQAAITALRRRFPLQDLATVSEKTPHGKRPPLPAVIVEERDWLEALSRAPPPCSRREAGMAANDLVSLPLHTYLVPCLLQPLSRLLVSLYLDERVWLPPPLSKAATLIENVVLSALDKKRLNRDNWLSHAHDLLEETNIRSQIEDQLRSAGIVIADTCFDSACPLEDDIDDGPSNLVSSRVQGSRPGLLQNISYASREKSGFRVLISGNPRSGQRHLASSLLHYFVGNFEVQKVDLATISQEGHGDMVQGLTQLLMRCASLCSCMIYMPRMDLWAMDILDEECDLQSHSPSAQSEPSQETASFKHVEIDQEGRLCPNSQLMDTAQPRIAVAQASYLWNCFIEQVDTICVNTSLMILATSEVRFSELPSRIKQFFRAEILRGTLSTHVGNTVPQFLVEVDENFDRDMIFDSCAVKLSKDLAQHFVQMLYYRTHAHVNTFKEDRVCDEIQKSVTAACPQSDMVSVSGTEGKLPCEKTNGELRPVVPGSSTLLGNVSVKGKSSLLLAISTFGYQILLYPHFAELCWVTSKLKEGPCANITGPWKGWPFSSCIVRPINSVEKVAAISGSGFIKIKEKSSVVRGLIAVGLSAYRGEYTSLRAVVSEVRKVLELLVGHINAKIQAGKDRYCYVRLMSQVAYLEDTVLSWAHSLQRLEVDAQPSGVDNKLPCNAYVSYESACNKCPIEIDVCKEDNPNEVLDEPELLAKNPQELDASDNGGSDLKGDGDISEPTLQDGEDFQRVGEASVNGVEAVKDSVLVKHANGSVETKSGNLGYDRVSGPGNQSHGCQHANGGSLAENNVSSETITENTNVYGRNNSPKSIGGTHSDIMCSYHCCSDCVVKLIHLVKEILHHYWSLKENHSTVEGVHDILSCLSSKLHTAVRRWSLSEDTSPSCKKKLTEANRAKNCQENGVSSFNDSGQLPMECHCHTTDDSVIRETKPSHSDLDLKFIFRDGVLATSDTNYDLSFHCNSKTFCLSSLIDIMTMSKEHLE